MESSSSGVRAVRMPLLERPCELRPVTRATDCDVQPLNPAALWQTVNLLTAWDLVNPLKVHAPGSKLVFAILTEVCMVSIMNWQPCLAIGHVRKKSLLNAKPEKTSKLPWKLIRTYLQFSMNTPF